MKALSISGRFLEVAAAGFFSLSFDLLRNRRPGRAGHRDGAGSTQSDQEAGGGPRPLWGLALPTKESHGLPQALKLPSLSFLEHLAWGGSD